MPTQMEQIVAGFQRPIGLNSLLSIAAGHGAFMLCFRGDMPIFSRHYNFVFALLSNAMYWSVVWCMSTLDRAMLQDKESCNHLGNMHTIMRSITGLFCVAFLISLICRSYVGLAVTVGVSMISLFTGLVVRFL